MKMFFCVFLKDILGAKDVFCSKVDGGGGGRLQKELINI